MVVLLLFLGVVGFIVCLAAKEPSAGIILRFQLMDVTTGEQDTPPERSEIMDAERNTLVLKFLEENGNLTLSELQEKNGYNQASIRRYISNLAKDGTIERIGAVRHGKWRVVKK